MTYPGSTSFPGATAASSPNYTPNVWVDGGAPYLSAADLNRMEAGILAASWGESVFPEQFVQAADGGDFALAIVRALAYATPLGLPVVLQQMYACKTTVTLNSGDALIGFGARTGLVTPVNAPITALMGTGMSGIVLQDFTVDGNCLTLATKAYARSIRFINCTSLRLHGITTQYTPDWATSFEQCTNVLVTDHVHRAGDATLYGGRDGIHFLDCSDVLLDGARIHSGDDCVGITSQTQNIARITVRNVTGVSESAAVVTLGNESTSSFAATDITVENIATYTSPDFPAGISRYVVKLLAQNSAYTRGVRVANVTGTATSYGIWMAGNSATTDSFADVVITGVRVVSTTAHGIYLNRVTHFEMHAAYGSSQAGAFDGINLTTTSLGTVHGCSSRNAAQWGLQLNGCTSLDVIGFMARDCGALSFSSNTGGNGRIVNCTDVQVIGGQFVGGSTTSYYGLSQSGNTSTVISTMTRTGGAN